jgi:hypothetical protein
MFCRLYSGVAVVEHSTHNAKIEGSNLAIDTLEKNVMLISQSKDITKSYRTVRNRHIC